MLIGSLPSRVREQYDFEWARRDEAAFRAMSAVHRMTRFLVPERVRSGCCLPFYAAVAREERHNARHGKTGFDLLDEPRARAIQIATHRISAEAGYSVRVVTRAGG